MKKVICSDKAPGAIGPYSQAIEANGMVFVSGQLPIDAATGLMPDGVEAKARQSLENIKHILEAAAACYQTDERHDEVGDERSDYLAERAADYNADCHVNDVSL